MGGNVFKNPPTIRMNSDLFYVFTDTVIDTLTNSLGVEFYRLLCCRQKPSHGDCDILYFGVSSDDIRNILMKEYHLCDSDFSKNSDVMSVRINNFQFDFINCHTSDEFASSKFYFNYSDCGNLLGRIGHKLGIKIGHKGISIVVRHNERNDHILKEIFLTTDGYMALEILGLDRNTYDSGFDTLEDIFKYVASSKYFDPEIFSLEHRSAVSRIRDKKRATYSAFLKWVETETPTRKHDFSEKSELGGYSIRLPYYNTEVLTRFPWVEQEVNDIIAQEELDIQFKKVYNGEVVSGMTGFKEKRLGAFMSLLKPMFTPEVKHAFVNSPRLARHTIAAKYEDVGGSSFMVDTDDTN